LTLIEVLVLVAIVVAVAVIVYFVRTLERGREASYKVGCTGRMKQIYTFAMSYSDKSGTRAFPIAPGPDPRAHDSLNVLLDFDSNGLAPHMFLCSSREATLAAADEDGRFRLDASNLSYAWTTVPRENTAFGRPLAADKYVSGQRR
jgi:hypothetical protein